MKPFVPERLAPTAFALVMSFGMALFMTAVVTWVNTGIAGGFLFRWMHAFVIAWPLAFMCVLVLAPPTRRLVARLTVK